MSEARRECVETRSGLPLWVGGDLDPAATTALEQHLARCQDCVASAVAARSARAVLRQELETVARAGASGEDLWPGIRARMAAEGLLAGTLRAPARRGLGWPLAAAAAVALFAWLAWTLRPEGPRPEFPVDDGLVVVPGAPAGEGPAVDPVTEDATPRLVPVARRSNGLRPLVAGESRLREEAWPFEVVEGQRPVGTPYGGAVEPSIPAGQRLPPRGP